MTKNLRSQLMRMIAQGEATTKVLTSEHTTCLEPKCGFTTETSLMMHIRRAHGLSRVQYLAKHDLPYKTKLYSKSHAEMMRKAYAKRESDKKLKYEREV